MSWHEEDSLWILRANAAHPRMQLGFECNVFQSKLVGCDRRLTPPVGVGYARFVSAAPFLHCVVRLASKMVLLSNRHRGDGRKSPGIQGSSLVKVLFV